MAKDDEIARHELKAIEMQPDECQQKYFEYQNLAHQQTDTRLWSRFDLISKVYYKAYQEEKASERGSTNG